MDYEKILKGIVQIINTTEKSDIGFANICTYIGENCPELRESEDERISREITEFILTHRIDEPNDIEDTNSWLAWLEKQGEQKVSTVDWKPSDEQMKLLEELVEDNDQRHFHTLLKSLYEQLKRLKEE